MPNVRLVVEVDSATGELRLKKLGDATDEVAKKAQAAKKEAKGFSETLDTEFKAKIESAADSLGPLGKALVSIGPAGIAAGAILGSVAAAAIGGFKAFDEFNAAANGLSRSLANQGNYTQGVTQRLIEYAEAMSRSTTFSKLEIMAAEKIFARFGMNEEQIKQATAVTLDFAASTGRALPEAAGFVGKAFKGQTEALRENGIILDANLKGSEKYEQALRIMSQMFGGGATAAARTFAGSQQQAKNAAGEALEAFGKFVAYISGGAPSKAAELLKGDFGELSELFSKTLPVALAKAKSQIADSMAYFVELGARLARWNANLIAKLGPAGKALGLPDPKDMADLAQQAEVFAQELDKSAKAGIEQAKAFAESKGQLRDMVNMKPPPGAGGDPKAARQARLAQLKIERDSNEMMKKSLEDLGRNADKISQNIAKDFIASYRLRVKAENETDEYMGQRMKELERGANAVSQGIAKKFIEDAKRKAKAEEEAAERTRQAWVRGLSEVSSFLSQLAGKMEGIVSQLVEVASQVADVASNVVSGNIAGAAVGGFGLGQAIAGLFGGGDDERYAAQQEALQEELRRQQERDRAANAAEEARLKAIEDARKGIADLQQQADDFKKEQLGEGIGGLQAMFDSLGNGATVSQERLDRLGRTGMAMFAQLRKQGMSYVDAMRQMGPSIDSALKAARDNGLQVGGGMQALAAFRDKVNKNQGLVSGAEGWAQGVEALRATGAMTPELFKDQMAEANQQMADLLKAGFSQDEALKMLGPGLLQLKEISKATGWGLDKQTEGLINQAEASGAFEGLKDPMDKLVELSSKQLALMAELVLQGGTLSPEEQAWIDEATRIVNGAGRQEADTGTAGAAQEMIAGAPGFADGSGGFVNFGSSTLAKLHGIEAVVRPEDIAGLSAKGGPADININITATGADTLAADFRKKALPGVVDALLAELKARGVKTAAA